MIRRTGVIGVGAMGGGIARSLLRAGFDVVVFDARAEAVQSAAKLGARSGQHPRGVAEASDAIILSLPDSQEVTSVMLDADGVLEGAHVDLTVIDMSTISPETTHRMAAAAAGRQVLYFDAPVSGTPQTAGEGKLRIYVGADDVTATRFRPLLESLGTVVTMGRLGRGVAIKIVNNLLSGMNMAAIGEAFALGVKLGLAPEVIFELISQAGGNSWMLQNKVPGTVLAGSYYPAGFRLDLMVKDIRLALGAGDMASVPMPVAAVVHQMYRIASAEGWGDGDTSAICALYERLARVRLSAVGAQPAQAP